MEQLALFLWAFLAATILPFSSEVAFLVALENGMPIYTALFFASSGNILAIVANYFFGYWLYGKTKEKLDRSKIGKKSLQFGHKYGFVALLLSWIPVFGDPLTLVAGLLRMNFVLFLIVAGSLRVLRYYLISFVL